MLSIPHHYCQLSHIEHIRVLKFVQHRGKTMLLLLIILLSSRFPPSLLFFSSSFPFAHYIFFSLIISIANVPNRNLDSRGILEFWDSRAAMSPFSSDQIKQQKKKILPPHLLLTGLAVSIRYPNPALSAGDKQGKIIIFFLLLTATQIRNHGRPHSG